MSDTDEDQRAPAQETGDSSRQTNLFNESSIGLYSPLISEFAGDKNKDISIKSFINNIEDIATSCSWPDKITRWVLRSKLKGRAATFFEQRIESENDKTFARAKQLLLSHYTKQEDTDAWKLIFNCKCLPGESIEEYHRRLVQLQERCNMDSHSNDGSCIGAEKMLEIFMNGIPIIIQEHMLMINPRSLDEALHVTKQIEAKLRKLAKPKVSTMFNEVQEAVDDDSDNEIVYSLASVSVAEQKDIAKKLTPLSRVKKTKNLNKGNAKEDNKGKSVGYIVKKTEEVSSAAPGKTFAGRIVRDSSRKLNINPQNQPKYQKKHVIALRVRGRILKCLLDPASDLSLISHETIKELGLQQKLKKNSPIEIFSALCSKANLTESIDLYFTLQQGNNQYIHTFYLLESKDILDYSAVVGVDFLIANDAIVNYSENTVSMYGEKVATLEPVVGRPPSITVIGFKCITIEGYTQKDDISLYKTKEIGCIKKADNTCSLLLMDEKKESTVVYLDDIKSRTNVKGDNLTRLINLCDKYRKVFVQEGPELGIIKNFEHDVELTNYEPIKKQQYQVPIKLREKLKDKLDEYLASGVIERSSSPWNIPMIVREKKDGDVRLVLDATSINDRTKKIDYPIFRIEDTFDRLKGKQWFSNIDLRNGYHQVVLAPRARKFFAFRTVHGKYQYRRMPMGAANSGIFFQMMMESILKDLIGNNLVVYQDDILVATDSIEEHMVLLGKVLEIFDREGIQINNDKSRFLVQEVSFLGHTLHKGVFTPSNTNLEALELLEPPTTVKQLRSYLGKLNFYARFLPSLSHVAAPLTDLLSTGKGKLNWEQKHSDVFHELQKMISGRPILHYPDYTQKFVITINTSEAALIGILEQGSDNERHPVGYYSKKLTKAQKNYSLLEKKALAVITVLEHFHHTILGYDIEIYTDRKAVEYLRGLKDGNSRVTDWLTKIAKYSPKFIFDNKSDSITNILSMKDDATEYQTLVADEHLPKAYTDGSCIDNGYPSAKSGIGIYWENCDLGEYSGFENDAETNNKAELAAIIKAMKMAIAAKHREIIIVSDSKYAIDNLIDNLPRWCNNGWISAKNKIIDNVSEFKCIHHLMSLLKVQWRHTPGHSTCSGNNRAHELAVKGRVDNQDLVKRVQRSKVDISTPEVQQPKVDIGKLEVMAIRTKGVENHRIVDYKTIAHEQENDELMKQLIEGDSISDEEPDYQKGIKLYYNNNKIVFAKGLINIAPGRTIKVNAIYVPPKLTQQIVSGIHNSKWVNHAGFITSCEILLENYFWRNFRQDIRYCSTMCLACQKSNPPRKKTCVVDFIKPDKPGQKIALDIIGPIVTSSKQHKYILTIIDMFSRYTVLCPMTNIKAEEVVDCLERNYITIFGTPETLISDRGSNFRSNLFTQACKVLNIKHYMTPPYHPASNGMVERLNKEIKRKLITLCENAGRSWDDKLHLIQFAHNNSHHTSLNTTPNILTFGTNRRFPPLNCYESHPLNLGSPEEYVDNLRSNLNDIRELAWNFEDEARKKRNEYINRNRVIPKYSLGDLVLYRAVRRGKCRNHGSKFIYKGPFQIKKCISTVGYDIGLEGEDDKHIVKHVHVEKLRPFYRPTVVTDKEHDVNLDTPKGPNNIVGTEGEGTNTEAVNEKNEQKDEIMEEVGINTVNNVRIDKTPNILTGGKEELNSTPTQHKYNTRNRGVNGRKCYKHWGNIDCTCKR